MPLEVPVRLIRLPDGRRIAAAEYGDPDGMAMFHFHATTSSRLEGVLFDQPARDRGIHVVALDRPGAGMSDPSPGRTLLEWPDDVAEVADAMGIERFAVVGQSVGGPHALACAHALPDRVLLAVPINPLVPIAWHPELAVDALVSERFPMVARWAPGLLQVILRGWGGLLRPQTLTPRRLAFLLSLPAADLRLIEEPRMWSMLWASIKEGTRQDRQIAMREMTLLYRRQGWGFDPFRLQVPVVPFVGEQVGGTLFAERLVAGSTAPGSRVERFSGGHMGQLDPAVVDRIVGTVASSAAG